jgi:hypothetical protein
MRAKQRGFFNVPSGFFEILGLLAALGLLAVVGAIGYGLFWLVTHVRFV